ncbi:hypothetical protein PGH44_14600 [Legionella pneumophila]|nr:hypothetical protein PGH44_14600 [Legionella pneumophila]
MKKYQAKYAPEETSLFELYHHMAGVRDHNPSKVKKGRDTALELSFVMSFFMEMKFLLRGIIVAAKASLTKDYKLIKLV